MENNRKPPMPGPYYPPFSAGLVGPVSDDLYAAMLESKAAQEAAETAQEAAEEAQGKAEDAQEAAEEAQGKAEDAQEAAEDAQSDAEAYGAGTRGGETVESDDPAYHNNAKYYSEQAGESAATFETDKTLAVADKAADAKETGARFVSDEKVINHAHSLVNYDYDTPFHQVENPDASDWRKRIGIDRVGMIITLNRQTGMQYKIRLKLNGEITNYSYATATGGIDAWTSGVALKTGHKYAAVATLLSGSCAYGESTTHVPDVNVYAAGEHSLLGTDVRSEDERTFTRTFTAAEGKTYNIALLFNSGEYISSNACILVQLIDMTESTEAQLDSRLTDVENEVDGLAKSIESTTPELVSGAITPTGVASTNVNYIRSGQKTMIPIAAGDVLVVDGDYEIYNAHVFSVNFIWNKRHVAALTVSDDHYLEIPDDYVGQYLGLTLRKTSMIGEDISAYVEDAQEHTSVVHTAWVANQIGALEGRISALEFGNVPEYYFEDDYIGSRIDDINTIGLTIDGSSVRTVFITDYHLEDNARKSPDLIANIMAYTGIRNVMFGGDAINHDYGNKLGGYSLLTEFLRDFEVVRDRGNLHLITGNHEYNNADLDHAAGQLDRDVIYNLFNEPMPCKAKSLWPGLTSHKETNAFYIDDDAAKMRIYGVDCNRGGEIDESKTRAVIASFSTVPEGYSVVLFAHRATTAVKEDGVIVGTNVSSRITAILDAACAMNDGIAATVVYHQTGQDDISISVDFESCQRAFVGVICGHTHYDGHTYYDGRFPVVSTQCDTGAYRSSLPLRVAGTITEQCFDVVQIDIEHKIIYMTRIGYGYDRIFHFGATAVSTTAELTSKLSGTLSWESSDESVATVSAGTVTAVGEGSAMITATDEDANFEVWIAAVS